MTNISPEQCLFNRSEAAEYLQTKGLRCSTKTLANQASLKKGPKFYWVGRYPVYLKAELDRWAAALHRGPFKIGAKSASR